MEELKIIVECINSLGQNAQNGFIAYILMRTFGTVLLTCTIFYLIKKVCSLINNVTNALGRNITRAIGIDCDCTLSERQKEKIIEICAANKEYIRQ
jgi:hypothetical protein